MSAPETYTSDEKFDAIRANLGIILGPLLALVVYLIPIPVLTAPAHTLAAILVLVIIWWITEPIPIPITALAGLALCVIFGVDTIRNVFTSFADPVIFLFMGSFILAQAMSLHKLDERIAYGILSIPGVANRPLSILFVFGFLATVLSMWISNSAVTAMLLPIGMGIVQTVMRLEKEENPQVQLPDVRKLNYSSAMMLMAAFGAGIGGVGTPVGSPPNLIGLGLIDRVLGIKISFFQWMEFALPLVIVMFLLLFLLIVVLYPSEFKVMHGAAEFVKSKKKQLGKMSRGEKNILFAFSVTVGLWVLPGILTVILDKTHVLPKWYETRFPEAVTALVGASLLFLLPVNYKKREFTSDWKNAAKIDWGTILLFGGGLSFGSLMFNTGLANALGKGIMDFSGAESLWSITLVAILLAIVITDFASNTAAANMVIPVVISLAQAAGVNPLPPALGACIAASFGFLLPVSTPPNAIAYGSGMLPITRLIKAGFFLSLAGIGVVFAAVMLLLPLFNISA
jgi:sodium-dependent dicarboxylate transporter 2/3/5